MTTLRRSVSGEKTKYFREFGDFAGNRESWAFPWKYDIVLGHCRITAKFDILTTMTPKKNREDLPDPSRFPGGL